MGQIEEVKANFSNALEVINYLANSNHVSSSTFYRHRRDGKIKPQPDGTYTFAAVTKYAKTFPRRRDATTILKKAFNEELARRTTDLELFFRGQATEIVALVAGDPDRVPDLIEYLLGFLARYTKEHPHERL